MKNRLILSVTLLSLMTLTFACGGAATNSNISNANRLNSNSNAMSNVNSYAPSNSLNTMSNTSTNKPANLAANKPATTNTSNSTANKIATTQKPPKGATAVCKDGTYSFSKTDSGQCSGHGGVDKKL